MFDYEAGEKQKLTMIMVAFAGLLAGMFFTMLLMPQQDSRAARKAHAAANATRATTDPDVTGGGRMTAGAAGAYPSGAPSAQAAVGGAPALLVDRGQASAFMQQGWLSYVWDLSAATAKAHQEEAIKYMTPECAAAYRANVWTDGLAKQVQESGLQSSFQLRSCDVSDNLADGSVVVKVKGTQQLGANGKGRTRDINFEYMLKQTPDGLKVAGISEGT